MTTRTPVDDPIEAARADGRKLPGRRHTGAALLALVVLVVYAPSLTNTLLNWDDPWLIERNTVVQSTSLSSLFAIFFDLSKETRLVLGAEYLPLRDLSLWLETPLHGLAPRALRVTNLLVYTTACLLFRGFFLRLSASRLAAELAAWVFALHPVHVESAAWLAGRKDVLALTFAGAALFVYAARSPRYFVVAACLAGAFFSKSMTVVLPALLVAVDLWLGRRPRFDWLLAFGALAVGALLVHTTIGALVQMTTTPAGGTRWTAAMTMGPVWLEYTRLLVDPTRLSIVQEAASLTTWTPKSVLGWTLVLGSFFAVVERAIRGREGRPLALWLFALAPLAPVSQVLFPLQNRVADRYLFLTVASLALGVLWSVERFPRKASLAAGVFTAVLAVASSWRATLFGDSIRVFEDATAKTKLLPTAPYQLGAALESEGRNEAATRAYREALRRGTSETTRRATNNLARLLVRQGDLHEALLVLERGRHAFPRDPKIAMNRVRVLAQLGRIHEARAAHDELRRLFPGYDPEAERRRPHIGP